MLLLVACTADPGPDREPPVVELSSPAAGSTVVSPIRLSATVRDDHSGPAELGLRLLSDVDGVVATPVLDADGRLESSLSLSPGDHTLTLHAEDAAGNADEAGALLRVLEVGLSQPGVAIQPAAPREGEALRAELVREARSEVGEVSYAWAWTVDGVAAGDGEAVEGTLAGQTWTLRLTASDGSFTTAAEASTTIGASPAISLWIAEEGAEVACYADAEAALSVVVDGLVHEGERLGRPEIQRGDLAWCGAEVEGAWVESEALRVGNVPPAGGAAIEPAEPVDGEIVRCLPVGLADADGDLVSWRASWTVDGVAVEGQELDGDDIARGQVLGCSLAFDDGAGGSGAAAASATVANRPPDPPVVRIDPDPVAPGATATCSWSTSDADGDAVTTRMAWTVEGVEVGVEPEISGFAAGDVLSCTVTADDGAATSSASASVEVSALREGDLAAADADVLLYGAYDGDAFGKALDAVDDLDGDGLPELLVSASGGGFVFLFGSGQLGGDHSAGEALASWIPGDADEGFGGARGVGGAGDVDGDGLGDLLIAAPQSDRGGEAAGAVFLGHGAEVDGVAAEIGAATQALFLGGAGDWLGVRVDGGDLDGDGLAEIVLAAPYDDDGGEKAGAVYVFGGGSWSGELSVADADATVRGAAAGDELGWGLDLGPDADGDGRAELILGAFYADPGGIAEAGSAYALSGLPSDGAVEALAFFQYDGDEADARAGYDVQGLDDMDGDGLGELFVGAYLADAGGADSGRGDLVYGAAGMNRQASAGDARFTGAEGAELASVVQAPGDVDGDGLGDLFLGAPLEDGAGAAHLWRASHRAGFGAAAARWTGLAEDRLGDELAAADFDGDGYADLAIGAQGADEGADGGGAVYLWFGPS